MVKNKTKFGFSLAEALVSMLVLSMFFLATSKIITTRPKAEVITYKHGYFECYMQGGQLMQKLSEENANTSPKNAGTACTYIPPKGISFLIIHAFNDHENNIRKFYTSEEAFIDGDSITGSDEVSINAVQLAKFHEYLEDGNEELVGNDKINEFINFLGLSHPTSSLYQILKTDPTYKGPALFIGW